MIQDTISPKQNFINITQKTYVLASDVMLLEANINYTILNLFSGKKIVATATLKHFEEAFPQNQFLRINKSMILNKAFVKSIELNKVTLQNEEVVTISRRRVQYVRDNF